MRAIMRWGRIGALLLVALTGMASARSNERAQVQVRVDGLSCPFCAFGMEKRLKKLDGLEDLRILVDEGRAVMTFREGSAVDFDAIGEAIRKGGFTPKAIQATLMGTLARVEDRLMLRMDGLEQGLLLASGPGLDRLTATKSEGDRITVTGKVEAKQPKGHGEHPYAITVEHFETAGERGK